MLLRNNALLEHPYLYNEPIGPEGWSNFVRALNSQSIEGTAINGAIEVVAALPALPDTAYPQGSVVFLTTDEKLYRNTDGSTWSVAVDGGDIEANSILTNSIGAGQVTAAKINVSQLSAISADMGALTAGTITLNSGTSYIASGQTAYDTGTGFWIERNGGTPRFSIGNSAGNKLTWNGATLTLVGSVSGTVLASSLSGLVPLANENVAAQGWTMTNVFSSTDADTVAWAAGTFTTAAGTAYSIGAGNTGNMVARTYIYLDIGVSTTAFQTTTTAATAVGTGKVLVAVAHDVSGSQTAFFQIFGGYGGMFLTAEHLSANSVVANTIAASAVTSGKISVSQLSAISADMGTLTTGEINLSSGTAVIRSGQTAYNTGTGFWLERNGGTPRLSIGAAGGASLTWNGTVLAVTGAITATSGSFTGGVTIGSGGALSSGQSAYDTGTGYWLEYNSGTPRFSLGNSGGNKLTWNGSTLAITGAINMTNSSSTFTPSGWGGFSSDPSGDINYLDLGTIVIMWRNTSLVGVSDETWMFFTAGVPAAIRPAADRYVRCTLHDESYLLGGMAHVLTDGSMIFYLEDTGVAGPPAGAIGFSNIFTDPSGIGFKGLPAGWLIMYPK